MSTAWIKNKHWTSIKALSGLLHRDLNEAQVSSPILPSSGSLRGVRWLDTDVSGLPIGPNFKGQDVLLVVTKKKEEFSSTASETSDLAQDFKFLKELCQPSVTGFEIIHAVVHESARSHTPPPPPKYNCLYTFNNQYLKVQQFVIAVKVLHANGTEV
jgi:hypothetical protein